MARCRQVAVGGRRVLNQVSVVGASTSTSGKGAHV